METHDHDGRGPSAEDPWRQVAERFTALGHKFREHYQGSEDDQRPADEELKQALQTLGDALDRAFSAVGSALRDPEVRERAKGAATALVSAFGSTFSELGEEFGKTVRRPPERPEPPT